MGFGNTVPPPKKDEDFLNSAMSSLYSVSPPPPPLPGSPSWGGLCSPPITDSGSHSAPRRSH